MGWILLIGCLATPTKIIESLIAHTKYVIVRPLKPSHTKGGSLNHLRKDLKH